MTIVSVVTGAGTGIGRAVAGALSERGPVVLVGRRSEPLHRVAEGLPEALVVPADVSDRVAVESLADTIGSQYGAVDVIVNNAGAYLPAGPGMAHADAADHFDQLVGTNLRGPFLVCVVLDPLLRRPGARIINIGSIASYTGGSAAGGTKSSAPRGAGVGYAASKAGVQGLTAGLARCYSDVGITVNSVVPGFIDDTEMNGDFGADRLARIVDGIALSRAGTPAEVAAAVSFLASEEASYITGEVIQVNGGWLFGR